MPPSGGIATFVIVQVSSGANAARPCRKYVASIFHAASFVQSASVDRFPVLSTNATDFCSQKGLSAGSTNSNFGEHQRWLSSGRNASISRKRSAKSPLVLVIGRVSLTQRSFLTRK